MSDLKPCPFCGEEEIIYILMRDLNIVECSNCKAEVPSKESGNKAVSAWNTRTLESDNAALLKERDSLTAERDRLWAEIVGLRERGRWRNINTDGAPEENDEILCWTPKWGFFVTQWAMQRECPVSFSSESVETGFWFDDDFDGNCEFWRPIQPPADTSAENTDA